MQRKGWSNTADSSLDVDGNVFDNYLPGGIGDFQSCGQRDGERVVQRVQQPADADGGPGRPVGQCWSNGPLPSCAIGFVPEPASVAGCCRGLRCCC